MDPIMLDGFADAIQMPNEDFSFDPFDNIDFDSGSLEDLQFDMQDLSQKQDMSSTSLPAMDREQNRESSPRLSRSLLLDLYRLPSPSPDPSSPDDVESLLVQHYFKDVCAVFSSFHNISTFRVIEDHHIFGIKVKHIVIFRIRDHVS